MTGAIAQLRRLARGAPSSAERCDLCATTIPDDHRHLLELGERAIVCVCEVCWARRSGEAGFRPTGTRRLVLDDFDLPEETWAAFAIPIGLAFFLHSSAVGGIVALYPSPAGVTESELDMAPWADLRTRNPVLATLEPDAEALVVNRLARKQPEYAIAPIDQCYSLVGEIKASWEGISGGPALERSVPAFFARMR